MLKPAVSVIIAAAGNSTRMGTDVSKQLIEISGKAVLEYSIEAFSASKHVFEIVITAKQEELSIIENIAKKYDKVKSVVPGGSVRQESVANALNAVSDDADILAIHDGARPLITTDDIDGIIAQADVHGAVCPVSKVVDTVKKGVDGVIVDTIDRNTLFLASTPQTFKLDMYKKAFARASELKNYTDDCSIVEAIGQEVHLYVMDRDNTKITTPKDLESVRSKLSHSLPRVGHGYDVHKLVENRKLILGGVDIPHVTGLLGHSDADVVVHAIMDSLLGAAAMGDIGKHFPDTADEYKGISSIELLRRVGEKLEDNGYSVINIDATIIAQAPKLAPYIPQMRENIANTLGIPTDSVNIKATTEEHLGFTGEKLGISSHSVAMIIKK